MSILESTFLASFLVLPGTVALGIILSPRGRASRATKLTPRILGASTVSVIIWFAWFWLYGCHYSNTIVAVVSGDSHARSAFLQAIIMIDWRVWGGGAALAGITVSIALFCCWLHTHAILGLAIRDYELSPKIGSSRGERIRHGFAKIVHGLICKAHLEHFLRPVGAGYAVVVWKMLEHKYDGKTLLYADVLQGEFLDSNTKRHGTLYTGQLDHIVCDSNGSITSIVLRDAQRWSTGSNVIDVRPNPEKRAPEATQRKLYPTRDLKELVSAPPPTESDADTNPKAPSGKAKTKKPKKSGFKQISRNKGFVICGAGIRNVSFRPFQEEEQPKETRNIPDIWDAIRRVGEAIRSQERSFKDGE